MMAPGRPELLPGLLLGDRYVLTSLLGAGGMGQVWVARDLRLEREVAVKLVPLRRVPGGLSGNTVLEAPGAHEARLLAALQHPNIVSVYDVGGTGGWTWIVMELVRGASLAALLAEGPLPAGRAVHLLGQVLDGLHAAHVVGVVHGDVKPSNILVDRAGVARLVDFGIGRRLPVAGLGESEHARPGGGERQGPSVGERPGTLLGTPGYVAPETAALGGASVSGDIWAAGVVLWESVGGEGAVSLANGPSGGGSFGSARAGHAGGPSAPRPLAGGEHPATGPTATGPTATGPTATGPTATGPTATGATGTASPGTRRLGSGQLGPGQLGPGQLGWGPVEREEDPVLVALAAVVRRAVAPDPEDRFPSAAAMRRALAAVGDGALLPGAPLGALPEVGHGSEARTRLVAMGIAPAAADATPGLLTGRAAASHGQCPDATQALGAVQDAGRGVAGGLAASRDEPEGVSAQQAPSGRGAIAAVAIVGLVLLLAVVVVVLAFLGGRDARPAADPIHAPAVAAMSGAEGTGQSVSQRAGESLSQSPG